jgi:uncharacterized membrane protein YhaH (DUF805 family)
VHWYFEVLRKFATFNGRARRREYWTFQLVNLLLVIALAVVDELTGTFDEDVGLGLLSGLYLLAILLPSFAVQVRRLHDTGRSGWWILVGLVPLIGNLVLIVFSLLDSQPDSNRFGPNPKKPVDAGATATVG